MAISVFETETFESRHHGLSPKELDTMLHTIGVQSLDELINRTIPQIIRRKKAMNLPAPQSEAEFLQSFRKLSQQNKVFKNFIGMGYYDTIVPNVVLRNVLENPAWYTAYTPYQAEIAQGRMEALINFQTLVMDLTGMEIANASLLDEGTATAEAMTMLHASRKGTRKNANTLFVSELLHPQTIDILRTRALPLGIKLLVGNHTTVDFTNQDVFGVIVAYPATNGEIFEYKDFFATAKELNVSITAVADLLSLTLYTPPGEIGADVVVGSAQRLGVPMGFGGPHAGFFATKDEYKRSIPGRIIGVSVDAEGNKAYRMALQTREQHIRREKATSNICTAQVLLSVMASMYAVYHGAEGLKKIASKIYALTSILKAGLEKLGFVIENKNHFDTITIKLETSADDLRKIAEENFQTNFRYNANNSVGISLDQTTTLADIQNICEIFSEILENDFDENFIETFTKSSANYSAKNFIEILTKNNNFEIPALLARTTEYLTHPVFNTHHTEHAMLRYMKSLENKDLSLVHSMIALGSCTMKLNATAEMIPVTWREWGGIHPFAPKTQTQGYQILFKNLEKWLCEVTSFDAISLQPNSGAQGEYAGLMTIRNYFIAKGESHRNIALIPSSAHGTNPASAVMAGMQVVVTKCDEMGNIDLADLRLHAEKHKENLACLMVTYPSTHGVFEESIIEICQLIHDNGGQVYMDGANMNAQVGLTAPAIIGADVCHLNLHKTFCIPHGGGGPGMGPIGVAKHLAPYLPNHSVVKLSDSPATAVSSAPYGSASILTISYAYIAMMGEKGLTQATKQAILNANYLKARLEKEYKILYTGKNGTCAHEFILDCRDFKQYGVEVADIAKRLMDYGFHAPTVSFPVAGTLMVEPTESENMAELDRFAEAMLAIRAEIREIEEGKAEKTNNVIVNAPHTAQMLLVENWTKPYSRQKAGYPLPYLKTNKFFPSVAKIDNAYGDRNLVCSCIPVEEYAENEVSA